MFFLQNKKNLTLEKVPEEEFLALLQGFNSGNVAYLKKESGFSTEFVAEWNMLLDHFALAKTASLSDVNQVLIDTVKLDSVKAMIMNVGNISDTLNTLSTHGEELTQSIDKATGKIEKLTAHANQVLDDTQNSTADTEEAFSFIDESFGNISQLDAQVQQLNDKTKKINTVIDVIQGVADQTNLLALNAAIEAARAGTAGLGFSVVADEVRKLAEHTKDSVKSIVTTVAELQGEISVLSVALNDSIRQLKEGKQLIDGAKSAIVNIHTNVGAITKETNQIAEIYEEQAATIEEFSQNVTIAADHSNILLEGCDRTGRDIFTLSQDINKIRLHLVHERKHITTRDLISIGIADHLLWRWRVYNMLLGYEKIDLSTVGDHKTCRLGIWYYNGGMKELHGNSNFIAMEKPHILLHKLAKEAVITYNKGDLHASEQVLLRMEQCSSDVVHYLKNLQAQIK